MLSRTPLQTTHARPTEGRRLDRWPVLDPSPDISDEERHELITQWSGLARSACLRFVGRNEIPPDMMQEALLGLTEAAHDYDPKRGAFPPFAARVIGQSLCEYRAKNGANPISYRCNRHLIKIKRAREVLIAANGEYNPGVERLAELTQLTAEQVTHAIGARWTRSEANVDDYATYPPDPDAREALVAMARTGLKHLSADDRRLIERRYGLDEGDGASITQLAAEWGWSYDTTRVHLQAVLKRMRRHYHSQGWTAETYSIAVS